MKAVALILVAVVMLNGCGATSNAVQTAASGTWQAVLSGGAGPASGFSFNAEFTVGGSGGALDVSNFQFLTSGPCFDTLGQNTSVNGNMDLVVNQTNFTVTGTLTFTVQTGSNTLTLNGTVTGTENGIRGGTLSDGLVTGFWTMAGSGTPSGCVDTGGSFIMTQAATK
jgi:hypothetical protein